MEIAIIIIGIACLIRLVHHAIGSPKINEDGNPEVNGTAIFSILGRLIARLYSQYENKENARIRAKFERWQRDRLLLHDKQMQAAELHQHNAIIQQLDVDIQKKKEQAQTWKKPNPFMAFGMCPICFGTWVSLCVWVFVPIMFSINPAFLIVGIPTSVIISNRL